MAGRMIDDAAYKRVLDAVGRLETARRRAESIDVDTSPVPREVSELRADPMVDWPANWPIESDDQPYRIPWQ